MSAKKIAALTWAMLSAQALTAAPVALNGILTSRDVVTISLSRPVEYKLSALKDPARLVIDLPGAQLAGSRLDMKGSGAAVKRITSRPIKGGARVVVELKELTPGSLTWDKGNLSIRFHAAESFAAAQTVETDLRDALSDRPAEENFKVSGWLGDAGGKPLGGTYLLRFEVDDALTKEPVWEKNQYVSARAGSFSGNLEIPRNIHAGVRSGLYLIKEIAPPGTGWTIRAGRPLSALPRRGRLALNRH